MFQTLLLHIILIYLPITNSLETPTEPINQDHINDLLVSHYDCRERLNVRRFSLNRVDDCSTAPHDLENNKAFVTLYVRAKATTIKGYKCSLTYTKSKRICGYDDDTNHYHDRQSFYQNTMVRYFALNHHECQNNIRAILSSSPSPNNITNSSFKSFTFLTDSTHKKKLLKSKAPSAPINLTKTFMASGFIAPR